jgi:hypothetical protein
LLFWNRYRDVLRWTGNWNREQVSKQFTRSDRSMISKSLLTYIVNHEK